MEIRLGKSEDHLDEVDDYLRGAGTGRKSLDTRIELMEAELHALNVLTRKISHQFGDLMGTSNERLEEIKKETSAEFKQVNAALSQLTIKKAIAEGREEADQKREATRLERFKEWMKLWGALGIAVIALIVPLATLIVQNWDRIRPSTMHTNVDRWIHEIEERKKDPATKQLLKDRYGVDE